MFSDNLFSPFLFFVSYFGIRFSLFAISFDRQTYKHTFDAYLQLNFQSFILLVLVIVALYFFFFLLLSLLLRIHSKRHSLYLQFNFLFSYWFARFIRLCGRIHFLLLLYCSTACEAFCYCCYLLLLLIVIASFVDLSL